MINEWFSSLIQSLTTWILNSVVFIYTNITQLDFDVNKRMVAIGVNNSALLNTELIINAVAWMIFGLCFYLTLINMISASADGSYKSSGIQVIKRLIFGAIFIVFAPSFMKVLYDNIQTIWSSFSDFYSSKISLTGLKADIGSPEAILGLFMAVLMIWNIITASINQVERFIQIYIWYYIAPIAMAFYMSEDNSDVTKKYIVSLFVQVAAIFLNQFLFWMFGLSLTHIASITNASENVLLNWFIAFALLSLAKNSEKILNALGFHTLPTPSSAKDMLAGLGAVTQTVGAIKGGFRDAKAIAGVPGKIGNTIGDLNTVLHGGRKTLSTGFNGSKAGQNNNKIPGGNPLKNDTAKAKDMQDALHKTGYDKTNKKIIPEGMIDNANDRRTMAKESGILDKNMNKPMESLAMGNVNAGMNKANNEFKSAVQKTNDFIGGQGKQATLSNEDAAKALNLDKSIPNFVPTPGGSVRKEDNGDFTMHGEMVSKDQNGNFIHRPASLTFSDTDRAGQKTKELSYGNKAYAVTDDGSLRAYETTSNAKMPPQNLKEAIANNQGKAVSGVNGQAGSSARRFDKDQVASVIKPEVTLGGSEITSPGYLTGAGNLFFQTRTPNKDGSYSSHTMMMSQQPVNNGDMVDGYMATGRQYYMGEGDDGSCWGIEMRKPTEAEFKKEYETNQSFYDSVGENYRPEEIYREVSENLSPDMKFGTNMDDVQQSQRAMDEAFPDDNRDLEMMMRGYEEGNDSSGAEPHYIPSNQDDEDDDKVRTKAFKAEDSLLDTDDGDGFQNTDSKDFR